MSDLVEVEELPPETAVGLPPLDTERLRLRFRVRFPSPDHRNLLRETFDVFARKKTTDGSPALPLSRLYVYANEIEFHVSPGEIAAARQTVAFLIEEVNREIRRRGKAEQI
jgi:hypothetical protein